MSGHPEYLFLAAGVVAYGGGIAKHGEPVDTVQAVVGTSGLVIVASLAGRTKLEPVVHALGVLFFLGATYAAVPAVHAKAKPKYKSIAVVSAKTKKQLQGTYNSQVPSTKKKG